MRLATLAALGFLALGAACTPPAQKENPSASAAACPDDGPTLPGTGICAGRAINYLDPTVLMTSESLPEGCAWTVSETMTGAPDEALLYQAAVCNGKTTQLEMRAGARSASLGYVVSGVYESVPADYEPVRIFTTEGQADPKAAILAMAKETTEDEQEAAACEIRPFNPAGSAVLADAFVIDVNAAYKKAKKFKDGEVHAACGPYGAADGQTYWLIRQGHAWFIDQGQDLPDFNANSIVWIQKGADGAWAPKP